MLINANKRTRIHTNIPLYKIPIHPPTTKPDVNMHGFKDGRICIEFRYAFIRENLIHPSHARGVVLWYKVATYNSFQYLHTHTCKFDFNTHIRNLLYIKSSNIYINIRRYVINFIIHISICVSRDREKYTYI